MYLIFFLYNISDVTHTSVYVFVRLKLTISSAGFVHFYVGSFFFLFGLNSEKFMVTLRFHLLNFTTDILSVMWEGSLKVLHA